MARMGTRMAQFFSLVALIWLAGCGGNGTMANGPVVSTPRQFGSLEFTLSATKAVYAQGEQVPLTFTVKNIGTSTITATAPSAKIYQIQIIQGNQVVWFYPQNSGGMITQLSFAPGEIKTFTAIWDQSLNPQGGPASSGRYTVNAWFMPATLDSTSISPQDAQTNLAANPIQIGLQF